MSSGSHLRFVDISLAVKIEIFHGGKHFGKQLAQKDECLEADLCSMANGQHNVDEVAMAAR